MADSKSRYSSAARIYNRTTRHFDMMNAIRYLKSKQREAKYNEQWKKRMVNLNDIVNQFTPGEKGKPKGVKYEFENSHYTIKVDMPSGYLRIYDKQTKAFVKLDGTPGNNEETHFKVKKRKEMNQ